jgi:DNA-binding SARP family transcriptional activator
MARLGTAMPALRIRLFGGLQLTRDGTTLPAFATQRAKGLFAYLVLNGGRGHPREVLVDRFWGEVPSAAARKNLRTDLWRIRSVLEPPGTEPGSCLTLRQDEIAFNTAGAHWLDVHAFEEKLEEAGAGPLTPARAAVVREALELYRGDLLDGFYDEWFVFERERLRLRYLGAMEQLVEYHHGRAEWTEAAACAQRILAHDPLREAVHRGVIRCHLALGDRGAALRQYASCERLLREELSVEPTSETRALRDAAADGSGPPPPADAPALDEALARLRSTAEWLEETGDQVRIAIRDLERARELIGAVRVS